MDNLLRSSIAGRVGSSLGVVVSNRDDRIFRNGLSPEEWKQKVDLVRDGSFPIEKWREFCENPAYCELPKETQEKFQLRVCEYLAEKRRIQNG